ncbi:hypothetical protein IWT25_01959 [Secundilactobacillus pentosiphilus]|uniref:Uncharacterized protein n=2 Tax=Secundilactobacillus pentosiphilus TaxID=1714682 RepID=A0A1Z5IXU9_9LACO|nr:hypothetical protein IWT25_01959 [Secundilactobacillus pentosiphilus]
MTIRSKKRLKQYQNGINEWGVEMQKMLSNIIFCLGILLLGFGLNYTLTTKAIGGLLILVAIILDPKVWRHIKQ